MTRSAPPLLFALALALAAGAARADHDPACHPEVAADRPHYIVGYGSLMETASKQRSTPDAGQNHPVRVSGYRREWNTRGDALGFSTTYLGVVPDPEARMVAVVHQDPDAADIAATDARETYYCRDAVGRDQLEMLDGWALPARAEIWIYVNKPDSVFPPDARWPIVQSYVDIFLTGCLQQQPRLLPEIAAGLDFADACMRTTSGWSAHWVNDRLLPRRPFIHQPNASTIDRLIAAHLPEIFSRIEIE